MVGIATMLVKMNNNNQRRIKENGSSLPFHLSCFTFKENIGTSATNINDNKTHMINITNGLDTIGTTN